MLIAWAPDPDCFEADNVGLQAGRVFAGHLYLLHDDAELALITCPQDNLAPLAARWRAAASPMPLLAPGYYHHGIFYHGSKLRLMHLQGSRRYHHDDVRQIIAGSGGRPQT